MDKLHSFIHSFNHINSQLTDSLNTLTCIKSSNSTCREMI